ncbi:MAG: MBL fold metallo-hydrolase, partial [Thermoguttaceae bacterium]|nr:MBL fold metallo-hydrolase [Thermoguttaceae bacterium]
MLTPTRRQFLTAVGASALCGTLSASASAEEGQAPAVGMTVCQLKNQTRTQMMGYIIRTATGELIVVDGGNAGDASHVLEMLEQLNGGPNPKVTAWFLTHAHSDH